MANADVSIGVAGTLGPEAVARLAPVVERGGFASLWVNDTPGADSLAALAAAGDATEGIRLATGVLPVDRRRPAEIVEAVERDQLAAPRLVLGIGAGGTRVGALSLVGDAVDELHEGTRARVLVGALGPKMRRLGAERADGLLLSWLTPSIAAEQVRLAREQASAHGAAPTPHVALYVRTALDPAADARLAEEANRYASYPAYAANFARLGIRADETVMDAFGFADRIAAYREAVDEVVLRVIAPGDSVDDHVRFIERAAELLDT